MATDRRPGEGRYAHLEREQRWLVGAVPADLGPAVEICDRYITGTRLRLRRAVRPNGVTYKLGQKVRLDPDDPERVALTNAYLDGSEYLVFATLGANELSKLRHRVVVDGVVYTIDRFADDLAGLVLAEVELAADVPPLPLPPFARVEVTHDDRWSGGALASLSTEARLELVASLAG